MNRATRAGLTALAVAVAALAPVASSAPATTSPQLVPMAPGGLERPDPHELDDGFGHLVVGFDDVGARPVEHVERLEAVPGTEAVEPVGRGSYAVKTTAPEEDYRRVPGVRSVGDDVVATISADPIYWQQWHLRNQSGLVFQGIQSVAGADIGAEAAWAVTEGAGTVVAVVDTGMEITHPDLAGAIWQNPGEVCGNGADDDANGYPDDCAGWDFANNDPTVFDTGPTVTNDHATHIGGIIAAGKDNGIGTVGVAPRAKVMPLKISDGHSMYMSRAAAAVYYAVDNGADVVNCSFGTGPGVTAAMLPEMSAAIDYARAHGVLVVAAAGNSALDIDASPTFPASFTQDNVITVGASTPADGQASFSNWGRNSVDLHAPGWTVISTYINNSWAGMHGTSMAAPIVAASAALVKAAEPSLDYSTIKDRLVRGSKPLPTLAGRSVSGGRLDIGGVLAAAAPDAVSFTFGGFAGAVAGAPVEAAVRAVVQPDAAPAGGAVAYRATLLTDVSGTTAGVSGAEVTTDTGPAVTGDDAAVWLSPGAGYPATAEGRDLAFGFALPAGEYALVAEATDPDSGERVGRPWAVFFSVAEPAVPTTTTISAPSPTSTTSPGSGGDGGGGGGTTTTTRTPVTGPVGPAPTSPPTTAPPGGATTTTTARPGPAPTTPAPAPTTTTAPAPAPTGPTPTTAATSTTTRPAVTSTTVAATLPPATGATTTTTRPPAAPAPTTTSTTLPPAPPPQTDGRLTASSVEPRSGTTLGGDRITIRGRGFAAPMYVLFDGMPGTAVAVVSDTSLLVTTPAHQSGSSAVRVSTLVDSVVLDGGFVYSAPASTPPLPSPTTTTTPGPPTTTTPSPPTTTTPSPPTTSAPTPGSPSTSTTRPAVTTTTAGAPGSTTTTTAPAPAPDPDRLTFGAPIGSRQGLTLRPLTSTSPMSSYPPTTWTARRCSSNTCRGVKL